MSSMVFTPGEMGFLIAVIFLNWILCFVLISGLHPTLFTTKKQDQAIELAGTELSFGSLRLKAGEKKTNAPVSDNFKILAFGGPKHRLACKGLALEHVINVSLTRFRCIACWSCLKPTHKATAQPWPFLNFDLFTLVPSWLPLKTTQKTDQNHSKDGVPLKLVPKRMKATPKNGASHSKRGNHGPRPTPRPMRRLRCDLDPRHGGADDAFGAPQAVHQLNAARRRGCRAKAKTESFFWRGRGSV